MMRLRTLARWFCLVLLGTAALVRAQVPAAVTPDQVKAAFIYNFAAFVTWPASASADSAIVIGVMGADVLEGELRRNTAARTVQSRSVSIRHVQSVEEAAATHILYIGMRENARLASIIARLGNRPVLVITEATDGLDHGSMINFIITDRVQFEISLPAAARAGLQLNSRLLSVASRIRKGERRLPFFARTLMAPLFSVSFAIDPRLRTGRG